MPAPATTPKSKNWLLAKSRQWHTWGGVIVALFLLIFGTTGIVLNYKKPIFTALGIERERPKEVKSLDKEKRDKKKEAFTTASGLSVARVGLDEVMEIARTELGSVPLERIELKDQDGVLTYKVKQKDGPELWVNAADGSHFVKGEYEKMMKDKADGTMVRQTDWGKIMLDLHTGKIGGETGKAIMSIASLMLLFLTVSGIYMWIKPILIRRKNAKARAIASVPNPISAKVPSRTEPELVNT